MQTRGNINNLTFNSKNSTNSNPKKTEKKELFVYLIGI